MPATSHALQASATSRLANLVPSLGLPAAWKAHTPPRDPARRTLAADATFPQVWQEALRARDMTQVTRLMLEADGVMPCGRDGITPLHTAAAAGCVLSVRTLLRAGASPSVRRGDGSTPLHHAGAAVQPLLLAAGADVGARDLRGRVPLHTQQQLSAELLTVGLNVVDNAGFTPLHLAALAGADNKVHGLLEQGADTTLRSTSLVEHQDTSPAQGRRAVILFKAGQRPYDLARFQYNHSRWVSSRYTRTLELLDEATPRAGLFSR